MGILSSTQLKHTYNDLQNYQEYEVIYYIVHMKYDLMTPQKLDKHLIGFQKVLLNQLLIIVLSLSGSKYQKC